MEEFEIPHRAEGFSRFFARIKHHRHRHGGGVSVAMEGCNGLARPLDTLLRVRGYRLYSINSLKPARFKESFPAAAKSDRIDARKGLELFQLCDHLPVARDVLRAVMPAPPENARRKRSSRRRRAFADEKTRVLIRLQSDLQAVCPGLPAITRDAENLRFLRFLTGSDDLTGLARLRHTTVMKIPGAGREYAALIPARRKQASFSHEVARVGEMIIEDARRRQAEGASIESAERPGGALPPFASALPGKHCRAGHGLHRNRRS